MKKAFLFSLGLIVAFSSLFVSCSDNNGDNDKNRSLICQISVSNTDGGSAKITNYIGSSANVLIGNGVEVVATPDDGYNFLGWYLGNSDVPVSTDAVFAFTASKDIALIAKFKEIIVCEAIDLGLSVKWATCNVGANSPEEYGDSFAWGETEPKEVYDWSTYKWCNGSISTLTKYNTVSSRGTVDNKTTLELSDDVARANWGGSWRMPTDAELTELREQCTWTWTSQNGVYGYKVTSNKSGYTNKSIFLPAAGYRNDRSLNDAGSYGYYWSSSLRTEYPYGAWYVKFSSDYYVYRHSNYLRYYGQSVRPVCP